MLNFVMGLTIIEISPIFDIEYTRIVDAPREVSGYVSS